MRTDNLEFIWDGAQRFIIRHPGPSFDDGRLELFAGESIAGDGRRLIDAFDIPQQSSWLRLFQLPEGTRSLILASRGDAEPVLIRLADRIGPSRSGGRRCVLVAEASEDTATGDYLFEFRSLPKAPAELGLGQVVERYQKRARERGRQPFSWLTYEEMESKGVDSREVEITRATGIAGDASMSLLCEYVRPESARRDAVGAPTALANHAMREPPHTPVLRISAAQGGPIPEDVRSGLLFFHIHNQLIDLDDAGKSDATQEMEVTISHETAAALMRLPVEMVTKLAPASGVDKAFLDEALADGTARIVDEGDAASPGASPGGAIEFNFFIGCYGDEVGVISGTDVGIGPAEGQAKPGRAVAYRVANSRNELVTRPAEDPLLKSLVSEAIARVYLPEDASDFSIDHEMRAETPSSAAQAAARWLRSLREGIGAVVGDADTSRHQGLPNRFQGFDALSMAAFAQCVERAGQWLRGRPLQSPLTPFLTFAAFLRDPVLCAFLCENEAAGLAALKLDRPIKAATDEPPAQRILEHLGQEALLPTATDFRSQAGALNWLRNYDWLEKLRGANVAIENYASDASFFGELGKYVRPLLGGTDELRRHQAHYRVRKRDRSASVVEEYAKARAANRPFTLAQLVGMARRIKDSDEAYERARRQVDSIKEITRRPGEPPKRGDAATPEEPHERLTELIARIRTNPLTAQTLKDLLGGIDVGELDRDGAAEYYEILSGLENGQQALTFVEVVTALESWADLPAFVRGLPTDPGEPLDEDQDSKTRLAKWLENAQRALPKPPVVPATYLGEAEAEMLARLKARVGKPSSRAFEDRNYDDLLAFARILVLHRGFEALRNLSADLTRVEQAQREQKESASELHSGNAKLRRFLYCWPSHADDAWKLAEELADRAPEISLEQLRASVDPSALNLQ